MNNQDYLNYLIEQFVEITTAIPTQLLLLKNIYSEYIYYSPAFLKLVDSKMEDIIGKTTSKGLENLNLEEVKKRDLEIIATRETKSILIITNFSDGIKPRLFVKTPLINPENNQVVGLNCMIYDYCYTNLSHQIASLYNTDTSKQIKALNLKLTKREKQIIFFLLRHFNSQEIAEMIGKFENKTITKSTIDSIVINNLFNKFEVTNRQALYDKLVRLGFANLVPKEILGGTLQTSTLLEPIEFY